MASPMIETDEVRRAVARWGTAPEQILKDHVVSHVLHGLRDVEGLVFYGGTTLNRSFLSDRLSEDIDLFLDPNTPAVPDDVVAHLIRQMRREFPDLQVESAAREADRRRYLLGTESHRVQVEFVGPRSDHRSVAVESNTVELRYSDLPESVSLATPTLAGFFALKTSAFEERRLERDLFDLAGLARIGAITGPALEALRALRGTGPTQWMYQDDQAPDQRAWEVALAHQTGGPGDPARVISSVREALIAAGAW